MSKPSMELSANTIRFVDYDEPVGWLTDLDAINGIFLHADACGITLLELSNIISMPGVDTLADFDLAFSAYMLGRRSK